MRVKTYAMKDIPKGVAVAVEDLWCWPAAGYDIWVGVAARDIKKDELVNIESLPHFDTPDVVRDPRHPLFERLFYEAFKDEVVGSETAPDLNRVR